MADRDEIINALRRLGYEPSKYGSAWANSEPELRRQSAQWRLWQKDEKPSSFEEVEWALLEALVIQGGCTVWRGDGLGCAAQIVWAQHERAEDEEALVMLLMEKLKAAQEEIERLKNPVTGPVIGLVSNTYVIPDYVKDEPYFKRAHAEEPKDHD